MASDVNVWMENWHATGVKVPIDQYEVDITVHWTDDAGERQERARTVQFPNILADVPALWLKRKMERLMLEALRKKLDMDPEPGP